jgi:NADPH-dependent curcumin reductase CurA
MTTRVGPNVPKTAWEVRMAKHVKDSLTLDHFETVQVKVPKPAEGEVLVRTDYVRLAAAIKELMKTDCQLPLPPWKVGDLIAVGSVGTVVRSNSPDLAVDDEVMTMGGWSEYMVDSADKFFKIEPNAAPSPVYYLAQGPTAYYGMADIAKVGEGDVVFVSGAAGGVGSLAGQIAKCLGAKKVIGSAGSKEKVAYLVDELGFDAAFDYHDGPVLKHLQELAPDGITVFFDNVGGEQFEAAIQAAAPHARFALCGALSTQIGGKGADFPRLDLMTAITKHLELRPFATYHTPEQIAAWTEHFGKWLGEGRFVYPYTVVEGGIKAAPKALLSMLKGEYRGNVSVKISK